MRMFHSLMGKPYRHKYRAEKIPSYLHIFLQLKFTHHYAKKKMIKLEIIDKCKVFRISWRVRVIFYNCYIYLALNCWKCRLLILKILFTGRFPTKRNVTFLKIQFCTFDSSLQCINLIIEDYERTSVLLTGDLQ